MGKSKSEICKDDPSFLSQLIFCKRKPPPAPDSDLNCHQRVWEYYTGGLRVWKMIYFQREQIQRKFWQHSPPILLYLQLVLYSPPVSIDTVGGYDFICSLKLRGEGEGYYLFNEFKPSTFDSIHLLLCSICNWFCTPLLFQLTLLADMIWSVLWNQATPLHQALLHTTRDRVRGKCQ